MATQSTIAEIDAALQDMEMHLHSWSQSQAATPQRPSSGPPASSPLRPQQLTTEPPLPAAVSPAPHPHPSLPALGVSLPPGLSVRRGSGLGRPRDVPPSPSPQHEVLRARITELEHELERRTAVFESEHRRLVQEWQELSQAQETEVRGLRRQQLDAESEHTQELARGRARYDKMAEVNTTLMAEVEQGRQAVRTLRGELARARGAAKEAETAAKEADARARRQAARADTAEQALAQAMAREQEYRTAAAAWAEEKAALESALATTRRRTAQVQDEAARVDSQLTLLREAHTQVLGQNAMLEERLSEAQAMFAANPESTHHAANAATEAANAATARAERQLFELRARLEHERAVFEQERDRLVREWDGICRSWEVERQSLYARLGSRS